MPGRDGGGRGSGWKAAADLTPNLPSTHRTPGTIVGVGACGRSCVQRPSRAYRWPVPAARLATIDLSAASLESRTRDVLKATWGFDTLRPLQSDSIAATLARRDSLTVLPTGGGKSLCYQLPPLVTGELTIVVSPLISLMQDQVASLRFAGVCAAALHAHTTPQEQATLREDLRTGDLRLLLVAPERLLTPSFLAWIGRQRIGAFAIDEAHCISQWGHDFRPEYRRLAELRSLFAGVPICAYTATATPRVREDIVAQLGLVNPVVMVGTFDRPNLTYRVLPRVNLVEQVAEAIGRHRDQASIVYCISRKDTEALATTLAARGFNARAYHAGLNAKTRSTLSADFRSERLNVICATVAFGMGIDRGDVRCVVHAAMPKSVEAYQQETGRAGRDGLDAECVLLHSNADLVRWKNLIALSSAGGEASTSEVIHAQHELLDEIHRFVVAGRCRHQMLSEYFGQEYTPPPAPSAAIPAPQSQISTADSPLSPSFAERQLPSNPRACGACDFCLGELEDLPDAQEIARKIISCVARCEQRFGAAHIADVLLGANTEKLRQRGHTQLSTYGILRSMPKERLTSAINQLVDAGHLARSIGDHPVLVLTSTSTDVLRNRVGVRLVAPKSVADSGPLRSRDQAQSSPLSREEQGLFEALRILRRELAQARSVPPFVILGDASLIELSRYRPASATTLLNIRGIGERKAGEFGTPLLACIEAYARSHNLTRDIAPPPPVRAMEPDPRLSQRADRAASLSTHAAAEHFRRGATVEEVMTLMQRARNTVANYLVDFIVRERPSNIHAWVTPSDYARVTSAIEFLGPTTALRPIFEKLDGSPGYDVIKLVVAHRMASGAATAR